MSENLECSSLLSFLDEGLSLVLVTAFSYCFFFFFYYSAIPSQRCMPAPHSSTQQRLSILLLYSISLGNLIYLVALVIIYILLSPKMVYPGHIQHENVRPSISTRASQGTSCPKLTSYT